MTALAGDLVNIDSVQRPVNTKVVTKRGKGVVKCRNSQADQALAQVSEAPLQNLEWVSSVTRWTKGGESQDCMKSHVLQSQGHTKRRKQDVSDSEICSMVKTRLGQSNTAESCRRISAGTPANTVRSAPQATRQSTSKTSCSSMDTARTGTCMQP